MSALTLACHLLFIAAQVGTNIWLSEWTSRDNVTGERDVRDERTNLSIYAALGTVQGDWQSSLAVTYMAIMRVMVKILK